MDEKLKAKFVKEFDWATRTQLDDLVLQLFTAGAEAMRTECEGKVRGKMKLDDTNADNWRWDVALHEALAAIRAAKLK